MQIPPSGGEGGLAKADAEQAADLQDRRLEHGRLELARRLLLVDFEVVLLLLLGLDLSC